MILDKLLSIDEKLNRLIDKYEAHYAVFSSDYEHIYEEMEDLPPEKRVPVMEIMLKAIEKNSNPEYLYQCLKEILKRGKGVTVAQIADIGDYLITLYDQLQQKYGPAAFFFLEMVVLEKRLTQISRKSLDQIINEIDNDLTKLEKYSQLNGIVELTAENIIILKRFVLEQLVAGN